VGQKYVGRDAILEAVAEMEPGTRFTETDDIGRKHRLMVVFGGRVLFDNGSGDVGIYDGVDEDASIEVTHTSTAVTNVFASRVTATKNPVNPILASYRRAEKDPAGYVRGGDVTKIWDWPTGATPDQIVHAQKVLIRLVIMRANQSAAGAKGTR
jgi:hypothetical protein